MSSSMEGLIRPVYKITKLMSFMISDWVMKLFMIIVCC